MVFHVFCGRSTPTVGASKFSDDDRSTQDTTREGGPRVAAERRTRPNIVALSLRREF